MHGEIFHQIGSILPNDGFEKKFSQILFYDTEFQELDRWMEILQDLKSHVNSNLVQVIQRELHKCNQLYNTFKPIGLGVKEGIGTCMNIVDNYRKLKIEKVKKEDIRRYKQPIRNKFHNLHDAA